MCSFNHQLYNLFMLPLERVRLRQKRKALFEELEGDVLEIGFGTGANFPYYPYDRFKTLTLTDKHMPKHVDLKNVPKHLLTEILATDVQALPFEDEQFDSVVFTLVFCSVTDPEVGFKEIRRVLRPGGRIYFIEHVEPVAEPYKEIFNKLTPAWKKVANGCHLNRDTMNTLQHSGFLLLEYHRFYRTSFVSGIAEKYG